MATLALVPEDTFDRIIAAHLEMPEKKRLQFKFALIDATGTRRCLRYDGRFYFYENAGVRVRVGYRSPEVVAVRPNIREVDREAMIEEREANATGNHHRNKNIRVPTKGGEPVRG